MEKSTRLEETLGLAHRRLQVERLDVLPVLLEKRDQEVDSQHGVRKDIFTGHLDMAHSDSQTEHLLQLELDGGSYIGDLVSEILGVRDGSRELSSL